MNGKIILVFIVVANLLSIIFASYGGESLEGKTTLTSRLFDIDASTLQGGEQPLITEEFNNSIGQMLSPESAGVDLGDVVGFLYDGLKLVFGFILLFTPWPILEYIWILQLPVIFKILFGIPLFILYLVSFIEFARGNEL